MKLFKKFSIMLICALCAVGICLTFTACNGEESVPEGTYVFYVYLDDGETPATGTTFGLCFDTSEDESVCLAATTVDENGRAEIDLSSKSIYNGGIYFHFGVLTSGYTYPTDSTTVTLADGSQYEHAYKVTKQINTYVLAKVSE